MVLDAPAGRLPPAAVLPAAIAAEADAAAAAERTLGSVDDGALALGSDLRIASLNPSTLPQMETRALLLGLFVFCSPYPSWWCRCVWEQASEGGCVCVRVCLCVCAGRAVWIDEGWKDRGVYGSNSIGVVEGGI